MFELDTSTTSTRPDANPRMFDLVAEEAIKIIKANNIVRWRRKVVPRRALKLDLIARDNFLMKQAQDC